MKVLLDLTRKVDMAMKHYEARASKLAIEVDSALHNQIDDTPHFARSTVVEHKLIHHLKQFAFDLEEAISDIDILHRLCQIETSTGPCG